MSSLSPEQLAAVTQAIRSGETITAIKLLHEATGCGLAEAKQAVERLQAQAGGQPPATGSLSPSAQAEIESALRSGKKIEAIRLYREATGRGLAEAKTDVEAMESNISPQLSSAPKKGGCMGLILFLLGTVLSAFWFWSHRA